MKLLDISFRNRDSVSEFGGNERFRLKKFIWD